MKLRYAAILLSLPAAAHGNTLRGRRQLKLTAAQKRQIKRDNRRQYTDPDRTQYQEDRERMRKEDQAYNRGRPWVDPYNDNYGARHFREGREVHRYARCKSSDRGCYFTADYDTYQRIQRAERNIEREYDDARYYSDRAYDDARYYADRAFDDRDYRLDKGTRVADRARRRVVQRAYTNCEDFCQDEYDDFEISYNGFQNCLDDCDDL